jgi:hypothetical protein
MIRRLTVRRRFQTDRVVNLENHVPLAMPKARLELNMACILHQAIFGIGELARASFDRDAYTRRTRCGANQELNRQLIPRDEVGRQVCVDLKHSGNLAWN